MSPRDLQPRRTPTLAGLILALTAAGSDGPRPACGRLEHPGLAEASGIVASRAHPGIYWVHNDSGHPSELFAVRRDGSTAAVFRVAAPNVDWEDIALDSRGRLYVGDIGDNLGALPVRTIHRLAEPDPAAPADQPLRVEQSFSYLRPRGARFDAEGLFVDGDRAIVVSKRADGGEAELYAIPLDRPAPLLRPARPERIGRLPGFTEPATGADLSADGDLLAVCSLRRVVVFRRDGDGWAPVGEAPTAGGGVEAVAWDGRDLVLAGEDRSLCRVAEADWRRGRGAGRAGEGR